MTRIEKIEQDIQRLTPSELPAFRDWFHKHDADARDRQIASATPQRASSTGWPTKKRAEHAASKTKPL